MLGTRYLHDQSPIKPWVLSPFFLNPKIVIYSKYQDNIRNKIFVTKIFFQFFSSSIEI